MPAIEKSGVVVNKINEHWIEFNGVASIGDVLEMRPHKSLEGNFNDPNIKR